MPLSKKVKCFSLFGLQKRSRGENDSRGQEKGVKKAVAWIRHRPTWTWACYAWLCLALLTYQPTVRLVGRRYVWATRSTSCALTASRRRR